MGETVVIFTAALTLTDHPHFQIALSLSPSTAHPHP